MASRRSKRDRIIDAALALAAERRWDEVRLAAIAAEAKVSLAELRQEFTGRGAILGAFFDRIDVEMLSGLEEVAQDDPVRDRLFDLLMRRLDALGPHKAAVRSIAAGLARDPVAACATAARLMRVQRWILAAAGIDTGGVRGRVKTRGLAGVYVRTFRTWLAEDDPGLPRTMATLDRALRGGERWLKRADGPIAFAEACAGLAASLAMRPRERARHSADAASAGDA